MAPTRLRPGDSAPSVTLPAVNREGQVSLDDYRGRSPVLIALFRGLHCPFCRRQLVQLGTTQDKLKAFGVETMAVLFTDRGLRYTLLAALFFAPSVVTIKWAMQCSDQYMGTLGGYLASSLLVTPIVLVTSRRHFVEIPRYWKAFVSFGLFASLTTVSQGTAYLMTLSSYVEAVKQVEILFAMVIGTVMFHEKQKVRDIAPGALVMLAGVVLLSLAG